MTKKSKSISVLLAMSHHIHEIHKGVAKYAGEAGWELLSGGSTARNRPHGWRGDGIIGDLNDKTAALSKFIWSVNIPKVSIRTDCMLKGVPRVIPDNYGLGRESARELLNIGHNHLAFFSINTDSLVVRERLNGFRDEVKGAQKHFISIDLTPYIRKKTPASEIYDILKKKLKKLPLPIGIGSQFDTDSNYICRAALDVGLKVPEEVSVIGIDNDPIQTIVGPVPLTSVDSNLEGLGYRAAEVLEGLIKGRKPDQMIITVPVGAVWRRQSTDRLAIDDQLVAKSIRYINENYLSGIDVEDIIRHCGTSRSNLFLKFQNVLKSSPKQELLRRRMQHAKKLLMGSDLKVERIATDSGFSNVRAFLKTFKKATGHTPTYFRSTKRD